MKNPKDLREAPVALIDLDGTLADFDGEMQKRMGLITSPNEPVWDPDDEEHELPHIQHRRRLIKSTPGFWSGLAELNDGFWILTTAYDIGFKIMVLSKGPTYNSVAWKEKIDWCREHLLKPMANQPALSFETLRPSIPHEITLTEDKSLVYGRVLIDDWPPYIENWLKWRPRGNVIMPARRYNENFSHPQVLRFDGSTESKINCTRILTRSFHRP